MFLDGLDDRLDHVRSDVLRMKPFPSIKQAYAHIRREDIRQSVMVSGAEAIAGGVVMAIKGVRSSQPQHLISLKSGSSSRSKDHAHGNKCTHCGSTKHTQNTCFKLHGYPDWWHELQARKKPQPAGVPGMAVIATADTDSQLLDLQDNHLSLIPPAESSASDQGKCGYGFSAPVPNRMMLGLSTPEQRII